jgi:hypothetical protein
MSNIIGYDFPYDDGKIEPQYDTCRACGDRLNTNELYFYYPLGDCCRDCIEADLIEVVKIEGKDVAQGFRDKLPARYFIK